MEEALEKIPNNVPDLVLSDIGLPGIDGISGITILKERYPELLILMLTVYDDNERIFDALLRRRVRLLVEEDAVGKGGRGFAGSG